MQFQELMGSMWKIETKLDLLIKILKNIQPASNITPEEKKVLKFCDKKHTLHDIAKRTGKTKNNVNFILNQLRDKAIIQSIKKQEKVVYGVI